MQFEFDIRGKLVTVHADSEEQAREMAERLDRKLGLGDVVHSIAQPIAEAVDLVANKFLRAQRSRLGQCGGCAERQAALNEMVPDVLHPFRRKK